VIGIYAGRNRTGAFGWKEKAPAIDVAYETAGEVRLISYVVNQMSLHADLAASMMECLICTLVGMLVGVLLVIGLVLALGHEA